MNFLVKKMSLTLTLTIPLYFSLACGAESDNSTLQGDWQSLVVRSAAAENAGGIQEAVDAFRADLGGVNNLNAAGTQAAGHREINWDGVPAAISSPNDFPGDTFRNRGLLISAPNGKLQVSTKRDEAAQAKPLFGNLNEYFWELFAAFSPEKLFSPVHGPVTELTFVVPGSSVQASVTGFGAVFTDVDLAKISKIEYYEKSGHLLHTEWVKNIAWKNRTLSFVGVTFRNGKQISKVKIYSGNIKLSKPIAENNQNDAVALDDFLYAEPKAQW